MKGILNRRKELGDAMVREAVEAVAVQILREQGLAALTMDLVSSTAGVSKGTLYNYYENKDELLRSVHDRLVQGLESELEALFNDKAAPARSILEQVVHAILRFAGQDRPTLFMLHNCPSLSNRRSELEKEFVDDLSALIQRGIDQGEFRPQEPLKAAWLCLGLLTFTCRAPQERPESCPPVDELPGLLAEFLLHGIAQNQSTPQSAE